MGHKARFARPFVPLVAAVVLLSGTRVARAVPSDAQVMKDVRGNGSGILSIKLLGPGRRVWSDSYRQYVWDRSVVVVRKGGIPEYPNAHLEVGGIASYYYVGGGRFSYNQFFVTYNSYSGIPAPSEAQISTLISQSPAKFYGWHYTQIVGTPSPIRLAAKPEWNWHTPNSVSFLMTTSYSTRKSSTTLEKTNAVYEVRLYRDGIKQPWKNFISTIKDEKSLGITTADADEIEAMKTLAMVDAEREAAAHLASLPAVTIPAFKNDLETFAYIHKTLREPNPPQAEAVLRQMLGSRYRIKNSDVLFDSIGEDKIAATLKVAYGKKGVYAEQYGPDPAVNEYQTNAITFWNADGRHFSRLALEMGGGSWKDGVKVGQTYRIADIELWTASEGDTFERIMSMAPEARFAPPQGARLFSSLGGQVAAAQQERHKVQTLQAIKWTPFTSASGRLVINFPDVVTETAGKMNNKYPMWTAEATSPSVKCIAVTIVYPNSLNRMQAQTVVESAVQGLADANKVPVKKLNEVSGTFGRQAILEPEGSAIEAQIFVRENVLYQLIMSGPADTMAKIDKRAFFGSFQDINPEM